MVPTSGASAMLASGLGSTLPLGATGAGVGAAGTAAQTGAPGLEMGIGAGSAPVSGAAAGGSAAAPGLGALAGAALPLGIAAFGMSRMAKSKAKDIAEFQPILQSMKAGPVQTITHTDGVTDVTGRAFTFKGTEYLAPMRVTDVPDSGERSLYDVYRVSTGEWGSIGPAGFVSDESFAGNFPGGGDYDEPPPVIQVVGNNNGRPIFGAVEQAPASSYSIWGSADDEPAGFLDAEAGLPALPNEEPQTHNHALMYKGAWPETRVS